ncbi:unnamed protein product [Cladocopium goreaui]|uniref:OTU domain-containing protein n=1 Tax=Cladocopium goreaui TaxID=2562237 RepID=A0A9P1DV80_9DINO|nr:unnamed protein product [Cladocopium goreaui]
MTMDNGLCNAGCIASYSLLSLQCHSGASSFNSQVVETVQRHRNRNCCKVCRFCCTLQASSSGASNKKGKGKGSGKSSGKSLPSKQRDANHDGSYGLIQALQKLTARAAKKPQGLLQRLKTLVQVTERGMLRPNKRKKDLPPHEAVPPVKPSTRFKSSENLVDGAPKPKTRWQRDRSWKARAQDWGVKTVLRGPTALCNALDSGDTGALLCQVQNLDDWNEALQISHAAGRTNVTVVLEAAPNMSPELGKLRYHGWTALNTRAAGYADDKLVQRLVWIARCSPNAPTLVPGSVLTGARRPVVQKHGHEAENLVRGFARVKGKDRALQLIKASGSEHKGNVQPLKAENDDDRGNEAMDVSLISVPDASDVEDEPMHVQGTKRKDQAMLTSPQKTGHDKKRMKVPERLQKVPNPGEGNCLFYCLAQAESTPGKSRSHRQVRAFVVAYMTKHFKKYEDFWDGLSPSNIPMEGGFDDYLQALEKDKAWAGYCEIEAYGEAMRRPVLVVHAKDNVVHAFNSHGDKDVVCLWYKDEHYELIVPSDADIQALWQNAEDGGTKGYRGAAKKARLAADNAPKGATRGDSILRLCKRASVSSDVPHRSILPWKLKHRQMYVQLNKFAKEQGPCGGRTARAEWLAMPGRQKCWRQAPKERQEALHKAWRLSATERRQIPALWVGDWNETPDDNAASIFLNGSVLAVTDPDQWDPDQDWAYFHQFAEKSMREALHLCGQPVPRPLSEPRGLQPDVTVGLAIENMQLQGLPDEWANILMFVWGHQVRWLCLGKAVHPTPEHVQTSMPQGDAFAPLALIMLLIRMPRPGGWQSFICARMRELNWEFRGPWMFAHEDLGHVDLSNPDEAVVKLTEHKVRESWRRVQFALWKKQSLKMNCKIVLLGPHVGVMHMIERFFTTWPGSGPLCVKT